jgi:hypothetical protein
LRQWEEESRSKQLEASKQLKEMQSRLSDGIRQRDRALDDVSRMEKKLSEITSEQSDIVTDTKKQLWHAEDQVWKETIPPILPTSLLELLLPIPTPFCEAYSCLEHVLKYPSLSCLFYETHILFYNNKKHIPVYALKRTFKRFDN